MRLFPVLLLLAWACSGADAGRSAWSEGRYAEARERFAARVTRAGDGASAELLYALAAASLRAGDSSLAQEAAARALDRSRSGFRADASFLLGCALLQRSVEAEERARAPEADPATWDEALAHARGALDAFAQANLASARDWPEARRNLERALLAEARIAAARAAARASRNEADPGQPEGGAAEPPPDLAPEELARLLERLEQARVRPRPAAGAGDGGGGAAQDW